MDEIRPFLDQYLSKNSHEQLLKDMYSYLAESTDFYGKEAAARQQSCQYFIEGLNTYKTQKKELSNDWCCVIKKEVSDKESDQDIAELDLNINQSVISSDYSIIKSTISCEVSHSSQLYDDCRESDSNVEKSFDDFSEESKSETSLDEHYIQHFLNYKQQQLQQQQQEEVMIEMKDLNSKSSQTTHQFSGSVEQCKQSHYYINYGNGYKYMNYKWDQSYDDITLVISLKLPYVRGKDVKIDLSENKITLYHNNQLLFGQVFQDKIDTEDYYWNIENDSFNLKCIVIELNKVEQGRFWPNLFQTHPTLDSADIRPELRDIMQQQEKENSSDVDTIITQYLMNQALDQNKVLNSINYYGISVPDLLMK